MDYLTQFHNDKYLFKCEKNTFDYNIKSALTKIFSCNTIYETQMYIFNCDKIVKCLICLQLIPIEDGLLIFTKDKYTSSILTKNGQFYVPSSKYKYTIGMRLIINYAPFMICDECCNKCIDEHKFIAFYDIMLNYKIDTQWIEPHVISKYRTEKHTIFINNSHKLIHRFYHTGPILFIMSTSDHNSYSHEINLDIITHIFQFIY